MGSFDIEMQRRLVALRNELSALAADGSAASQVVELDQARVGRLSRMDAMQAQAMSQASDRRRVQKLRMIDEALRRIENDDFGRCLACDEPIARERLAFDPTATHCIGCASEIERGG